MHAIKQTASRFHISSLLISIGLGLAILCTLAGTIYFWNRDTFNLAPAARYSLLPGFLLILVGLLLHNKSSYKISLREDGLAWGLIALIFSDWLLRRYNFFQGPLIRGEIFLLAIFCFFSFGKNFKRCLYFLAPLSAIMLACAFFAESSGNLLFSDDNPTFLYRLWLLKSEFPNIPFYNPYWNAGLDQRDFFATGSLNVFLIFSSLLYLFEPLTVYNYIIATILFLLLPCSIYAASRIMGYRKLAAYLSAALALCCSLLWYRWVLKYGTLGFSISALLVPINLAFASLIISTPKLVSTKIAITSFITISLMLFWSPAALIFIPSAVLALFNCTKIFKQPTLIVLTISLLVFHLPWISLFWSVSKVSNFVSSEKQSYDSLAQKEEQIKTTSTKATTINGDDVESEYTGVSARQALKLLRQNSVSTNPLLLLLAVPVLLKLRSLKKIIWLSQITWLIFLGAIASQIWPQLEFDRMFIVLAMILCIPTGRACERLLHRIIYHPHFYIKLPASFVFALLILGPFSGFAILRNKSLDSYYFATENVSKLANTIATNSADGRAFFSGFVLHQFNHGHLAPLALMANIPLVASSPFHNQWTHKDIIPESISSQGSVAIQNFLDLHNATLVLAHEQKWIDYFESYQNHFSLIADIYPFKVYRRLDYKSNYFIEGQGEILEQNFSSIKFRLQSTSAMLKFKYFNFLTSSACQLTPLKVLPDLDFIKLDNCPTDQEIIIKAGPVWRRVLG